MRGSLRVAKIFNIPVEIHWSFFLLFGYVLYLSLKENWGVTGTLAASLFVIVLFVCVVLHEFGHALMARRFHVSTRDITLYPIGGVARLERLPRHPMQEFWVAIAGPLVNLGIALLLLPFLLILGGEMLPDLFYGWYNASDTDNFFIPDNLPLALYMVIGLIVLNLTLALFNLIPAFPMDGGRVLRAILSHFLGHLKATRIASLVGQLFAGYFIFNAIMGDGSITQGLIGVFVFLSAGSEARLANLEHSLEALKVADWMKHDFLRVHAQQVFSEILSFAQEDADREILVFDDEDNPVGIVSSFSVVEACLNGAGNQTLARALQPLKTHLRENQTLQEALNVFQETGAKTLPVVGDSGVSGILEVHQIYTIHQVMRQSAGRRSNLFSRFQKNTHGKH